MVQPASKEESSLQGPPATEAPRNLALSCVRPHWPPGLLRVFRTWRVNDGQVGTELVLDAHHNLLGPELCLAVQPCILVLDVVLEQGGDGGTVASRV